MYAPKKGRGRSVRREQRWHDLELLLKDPSVLGREVYHFIEHLHRIHLRGAFTFVLLLLLLLLLLLFLHHRWAETPPL